MNEQRQEDMTAILNLRMPPSMLAHLRDMAAREDRQVAWLVRKAITDMLSAENDADA